ncbi:transposase [Xanthomonas euvesicatoria pv. allii]|nr:transposase [Xanthomonas euvesicatoria pv. alangii]MBV6890054.1 transposase [Xanthomonas campestris pv. spermacoces]MCP3034384.1 transposase [Xanthomonas euvesicatoria pv. allii]PPU86547.1 hypothetical protein XaclCFBP3371_21035 [Xanthomonas euvesicatoria pv. citrumelonis]QTK49758.1 integrase core domain-containing protein [Xanthomonas euvesicatoria pv. alfalfae]
MAESRHPKAAAPGQRAEKIHQHCTQAVGAAAQRHPDPNPAGIPPSAYIERFSCTFRTEVLDRFVFTTLDEVRHMAEDLCHCYSRQRPH